MENAVDAVLTQKHGARKIYLRGELADGKLGIVVDNTFMGQLQQKDGVFLSSKHPGGGIGIRSVMTIVEKHGGPADFGAEKDMFRASVLIPTKKS